MPQHRPTQIRPRRLALATAVGLALCTLSHPARAMGFAAGQVVSTLGQPLDFSVQIAGETDAGAFSCLSAEVLAGDTRVDPQAVSSHLVPASARAGAWLRVQTTVAIDEPVVTVVLGAGCGARISRRFVVFIDPPGERLAASPSTLPMMGAQVVQVAAAPSTTSLADDVATTGAALAASPTNAGARPSMSGPVATPQPRVASASSQRSVREPKRRLAVRKTAAVMASGGTDDVSTAATARTADLALHAHGARLKLDDEPDFAALAAASTASTDASSPSTTASTDASARYSALEARVAKLDADSAAASANVDRLRRQLHAVSSAAATATPESPRPWLWQGLSAVLGLAVALLAWQRLRPAPSADWRDSTVPVADAEVEAVSGPLAPVPLPEAAASTGAVAPTSAVGALVSAAVPSPAPDVGAARPLETTSDASPAGGLTVEELVDLEQQFDFFTALGQDASAIELMSSLLGNRGSEHPMPYLKLMEVYRRLDQQEAFDRVREAFCAHFNVVAPNWQDPPAAGRTIEDYPEQLATLIDAWPSPSDAAARLDGWIARSESAANDARLDMPAFCDLMFLHTLAREMTSRDSRAVALQPLTFDLTEPEIPVLVASIAPPEWARQRTDRHAAPVDIDLDLQLAGDDIDDGRFDLPLSPSQAAAFR